MAPMRLGCSALVAISAVSCGDDALQALPPSPRIEITPEQGNFGQAPLGEAQRFTFAIRNLGSAPLRLGADTRIEGDPELSFDGNPAGEELAPQHEVQTTVTFLPDSHRTYSAQMVVPSNDPDRPEVRVPLKGSVADTSPVCDLVVTSGATESGTQYNSAPFSNVTLSAAGSWSATYLPSDLTYEWTLAIRPGGSAAALSVSDMNAALTLDFAGSYVVRVQVLDPEGQRSGPCEAAIQAVPARDLWIEMFWTSAGEDMDLHLTLNNAAIFDPNDCYFANCKVGCPGGPGCVAWGAAGSADDPALDLDNIGRTGPENINIERPALGAYTVYVHDHPISVFTSLNPTTVRVYLGGTLARTYVSTSKAATADWGSGEGNQWKVCTISMPSGDIVDHWQIL